MVPQHSLWSSSSASERSAGCAGKRKVAQQSAAALSAEPGRVKPSKRARRASELPDAAAGAPSVAVRKLQKGRRPATSTDQQPDRVVSQPVAAAEAAQAAPSREPQLEQRGQSPAALLGPKKRHKAMPQADSVGTRQPGALAADGEHTARRQAVPRAPNGRAASQQAAVPADEKQAAKHRRKRAAAEGTATTRPGSIPATEEQPPVGQPDSLPHTERAAGLTEEAGQLRPAAAGKRRKAARSKASASACAAAAAALGAALTVSSCRPTSLAQAPQRRVQESWKSHSASAGPGSWCTHVTLCRADETWGLQRQERLQRRGRLSASRSP